MTQNSLQVFKGGWDQLENAHFTDNQSTTGLSGVTHDDIFIKPDGTTLFLYNTNTMIIETYLLSTPWDVSTRGSIIATFAFTEDPTSFAFTMKFDGTKLYILGVITPKIYEYIIPIPWDISSIVSSPVSLALSGATLCKCVFSTDGDFLYVVSSVNNLHRYPLPIPWDVTSNTTNDSITITNLTEGSNIIFKPEGDKMYIGELFGDDIAEYDLSIPWDIQTATFLHKFIDTIEVVSFVFRSNGLELIILHLDDITKFHVEEYWNVLTASHFSNSFTPTDTLLFAVSWKPDGTVFFILDGIGDEKILAYSTQKKHNITGATLIGSFALDGITTNIQGMFWRRDGLRCYIAGVTTNSIIQLNLTTAWNITTMSDAGISYVALVGEFTSVSGVYFRDDGNKMYVSSQSTNSVFEYDLVDWDLSTASINDSKSVEPDLERLASIFFKPDGRQVYFADRTLDVVARFSLTTAWDITTIKFEDSLDISMLDMVARGIFIREDNGKQLFVIGTGADTLFSFEMSLEFNNSIINNDGDELATNSGETLVYA